jgi:hypothetical protein
MLQTLMSKSSIVFVLLLLCSFAVSAQPDYTLPLAKPEKYKDKELAAERTDEKKFTLPRRLFQGMITHYNYYYNAQTKLDAIVQKAKLAHKDDYTQLLPFYNYSTKTTAADSAELDSILYKATAGIVLHDLRNTYIDNLYLLIGKSYFFWEKFDSAYRIFQFINYNFFPKDKNEYLIVVGANDRSSKGELNISTAEKKGVVHKAFSQPPSRNEALLWLAKTYASDSLFAEAYSLVQLLKKDPLFPKRLYSSLNEVQAYVFYRQQQWDSTAHYLSMALENAPDKTELGRWEFLLGQLYTKLGQPEEASSYFNKAKAHTTDPVLYIYARIYDAQLVRKEGNNAERETLYELMKLSKKERFDGFEDILYFAAGNMSLQLPDTSLAKNLFQKSTKYNTENVSLKNKSFLQLAEIGMWQRDYAFAASCYDSINLQTPDLIAQSDVLEKRKQVLKDLVLNITTVAKEDSLQRIAGLPEKEREDYLKSLSRKLRKAQGLKEEEYINPAAGTSGPNADVPLFSESGSGANWYFNAASQKAKGSNEFKVRWGKRPNVDNWRRQGAVDAIISNTQNNFMGDPSGGGDIDNVNNSGSATNEGGGDADITIDGLRANLPLTEAQLKKSNISIMNALFRQGEIYKNQFEDYVQAFLVFEELKRRFPEYSNQEELIFELYYCGLKAGFIDKANAYKKYLTETYVDGEYTEKINTAKQSNVKTPDSKTQSYEAIYRLFIEGKFTEAVAQKQIADSIYKTSYWTPQLLYIESLYYIKSRNDSVALETLTNIERNFPGTPMAERASVLKDVLNRRGEIEAYLTNTNIVRAKEEDVVIPFDDGPKVSKVTQGITKDTTNKVVLSNQPTQKITLEKPKAPIQQVGLEKNKPKTGLPSAAIKPATDSARIKAAKDVKVEMAYIYNGTEPYLVVMYFDEVDPIYISESKIAMQRYNTANHANETINLTIYETKEDLNWLEMGPSPDVTSGLSYFEEIRQSARSIVPWLPADKYNFILISERNLETLKTRKNIEEYKLFIRQYIKDKF